MVVGLVVLQWIQPQHLRKVRSTESCIYVLYLLVLVTLFYVVNCQSPLHFTLAPGTPPENVQVTAQDSSSVVVSWQEPAEPNGRITHYTVYVNGSVDGSMTSDQVLTHIISGLSPAQLVRVRVSASTQAGEGPQSNESSGMSQDGSKCSHTDFKLSE